MMMMMMIVWLNITDSLCDEGKAGFHANALSRRRLFANSGNESREDPPEISAGSSHPARESIKKFIWSANVRPSEFGGGEIGRLLESAFTTTRFVEEFPFGVSAL